MSEKHEVTTESKGQGMMRCLTPVCTCGWRGIGYEAYNDWQHTLVNDQMRDHLVKAAREQKS